VAEVKYSQAMKKLTDIISQIENEDIDVDELSKKVKEAVGLIKVCKDKIEKAELDVKSIVEAFEKGK
jgi:exodeoxyribonuclease VII small subunit